MRDCLLFNVRIRDEADADLTDGTFYADGKRR